MVQKPEPLSSKEKRPEAARKKASGGKYYVQAVGRAFDILELLSHSPETVSLVQISRTLRQSKSSVFRILNTLAQRGFVERRPGDQFALLPASRALIPDPVLANLTQAADPIMRDLGREFRESVSLAYLFENHIGVVAVVDSPQKVRMGNVLGGIIPPHASSLGKCITAFQSDPMRERLLRAYGIVAFTPKTITDETRLHAEYARIREQGYAVDAEESTAEGHCVGAPIRARGDRVVAALSISCLKSRLVDEDKLVEAVRRAAEELSRVCQSGATRLRSES